MGQMPMMVRTFRLPGWATFLLVLAALALIPVALVLAVGVGALALVGGVVGALVGPKRREIPPPHRMDPGQIPEHSGQVLEAEYEVKDEL